MAALVRHDAAIEAAFPRGETEFRADSAEIARLYDALDSISDGNPRAARLLASGLSKIARKVIEEASELALEAVRHRSRNIVRESPDLISQLVVLWHESSVTPGEIRSGRRADKLGLAEKPPKASSRCASTTGFGE